MPITNTTPPPSHGGNQTHTTSKRVSNTALTKKRTDAIAQLGQFAQMPLIALKQYPDVGAINLHWPKISEEIAKIADQEEAVAKIIDPLLQVGPYAGLIAAVLPLVIQIGVNHNRVSPGAMGTVPGSALGSQIEAALAQQELEALQIQLQAEQEAQKVRKQINDGRKEMETAMQQVTHDGE